MNRMTSGILKLVAGILIPAVPAAVLVAGCINYKMSENITQAAYVSFKETAEYQDALKIKAKRLEIINKQFQSGELSARAYNEEMEYLDSNEWLKDTIYATNPSLSEKLDEAEIKNRAGLAGVICGGIPIMPCVIISIYPDGPSLITNGARDIKMSRKRKTTFEECKEIEEDDEM